MGTHLGDVYPGFVHDLARFEFINLHRFQEARILAQTPLYHAAGDVREKNSFSQETDGLKPAVLEPSSKKTTTAGRKARTFFSGLLESCTASRARGALEQGQRTSFLSVKR